MSLRNLQAALAGGAAVQSTASRASTTTVATGRLPAQAPRPQRSATGLRDGAAVPAHLARYLAPEEVLARGVATAEEKEAKRLRKKAKRERRAAAAAAADSTAAADVALATAADDAWATQGLDEAEDDAPVVVGVSDTVIAERDGDAHALSRIDLSRQQLPPVTRRNDDASPPRRRRHIDDDDASPPRRRRHIDDDDASPPRLRGHIDDDDASPPRRRRHIDDDDASPPRRHRDAISDKGGHRDASPVQVYRDRHGRRLDTLTRMMARDAGKDVSDDEADMAWGTGLVQRRTAEEEAARAAREASKPFARYQDDSDLEAERRRDIRWDDPMRKRLRTSSSEHKDSKRRRRVKQRWTCTAPPNRFNILPGPLWDGVDRSNGFEQRLFRAQSTARAKADAEYKWSVADL